MAQENRELQLEQALSGLVDNYYELHSNGEWCPACGGEYIEDDDALLSTKHDDDCALAVAVKLLVPSLNQDSGITPENLLDALIRHHIPIEVAVTVPFGILPMYAEVPTVVRRENNHAINVCWGCDVYHSIVWDVMSNECIK